MHRMRDSCDLRSNYTQTPSNWLKMAIFVSRSKTRALRRISIWFSGSRYSYLGARPLDKRNASAGDEIERDWKTNNWQRWPLYTGSTVLRYLVAQDWLFIAGLVRLWWYSKRMLLSIQQFVIYLKVYWNGRTVFLFIILRVYMYLTILAVTWLFLQVVSEISFN